MRIFTSRRRRAAEAEARLDTLLRTHDSATSTLVGTHVHIHPDHYTLSGTIVWDFYHADGHIVDTVEMAGQMDIVASPAPGTSIQQCVCTYRRGQLVDVGIS